MGLPASRDVTLGPGSTIPGSIINTLQDMIIGAKMPGQNTWYHGAKFQGSVAGGWAVAPPTGIVAFTTPQTAFAPIDLHAGTRLANVTIFYTTNNINMGPPRLRRTVIATQVTNLVWTGVTDATGGIAIKSQTNAPNHIMLATDAYNLELVVAGGTLLYGALLNWDVP